jgi:hypothetical protein
MPNYVIYDPASTPVANLVTQILRSFDEGQEGTLSANRLKDPSFTGLDLTKPIKWDGTNLVNLSQAEIDSIAAASAAATLSAVKQAAKNIFVTPSGPQQQAIRLAILTIMIDIMLPEINALRTNAAIGLAARTQTQLNNAFTSAYVARIDALT